VRSGWQRRPITVASYKAKDKWSGRGGKLEGADSRVGDGCGVCGNDGGLAVILLGDGELVLLGRMMVDVVLREALARWQSGGVMMMMLAER